MLRSISVCFSLLTAVVLIPPAAPAQSSRVDLRAHWGYLYRLDDSPPEAWAGGGSVTAAVGPRLRVGLEVLHANLFGKYDSYKQRARLFHPMVEYEFLSNSRFRPFMVIGIGYTQYRSWLSDPRARFDPSLPERRWETQGRIHYTAGLGARLFLTKRLFLAPEVRIGLVPVLRSTVSVGFAF